MKRILLKNKFQFIKYIIGALFASLGNIFISFGLMVGFDLLSAETSGEMIQGALVAFALFISVPLSFYISRWLRIGFMRDVLIDVRHDAFENIMDLDIQAYRERPQETYLSNLVSDLNLFEKDYFLSILNITSSMTTFVFGSILVWFYAGYKLALITIGVAVLLYVISKMFEMPVRRAQQNNQDANVNYNMELSNILNGMEVMKLYRVEGAFTQIVNSVVITVETLKNKYHRLNGTLTVLTEGIATTYQVGALVFATYLWTIGEIQMGAMILVFNMSGSIVWNFVNVTSFMNRYKAAIDVYNRLTQYKRVDVVDLDTLSGFDGLSVQDLGYSYGTNDVFNNLNFKVEPQTKVLIYGPSGVGKTTLLNCMTHTLTDYRGEISVNGFNLANLAHQDYLKVCGYVRQQHFMFEDTIKQNIVLNQPYDEKRLQKVLEDVDLWTWVSSLPDGVEHRLIQNGNNISGGQKQRVSIARELYRECDVLFIDEPSASLDDETSRHIYDTILGLNRTVVCVSHRHLDYLQQRFDAVINLGGEV